MFSPLKTRLATLWADPRRRFGFLLLGSLSLVTLGLCWWLPQILSSAADDQVQYRLWLFLGRGILLGFLALVLLFYFQFRDLRRDWDSKVPWFHNLILGSTRSQSIREFYASVSWSILAIVAGRTGLAAALELFLLWEIFLLLLLLAEFLSDPSQALLASPAGRTAYVVILGKRIPTAAVLGATVTFTLGVAALVNDVYQQSQNRKVNFAKIQSDEKLALAKIQSDEKLALAKIVSKNPPKTGGWFS